jgi:hypothetical protein
MESGMNFGIVFLVIISVVILGQLVVQDRARRREHEEVLQRLETILGERRQ